MKTGTKTQFCILILVLFFAYVSWFEIMIGCLQIYALTGNAHSKRLLGEYYATISTESSAKAAVYFQQALKGYKINLPGTPIEQKRWIEYLIGNQYECGKGVEPDLAKAKHWYQEAIKNGFPKGKNMLDEINQALSGVKSNEKATDVPKKTKKITKKRHSS